MTAFEVSLGAARKRACGGAIRLDGILANAFVMRAAVGNAHDMAGAEVGVWHRTAEVVRVGSLIDYDYIETADGKRILILGHENDTAKQSFEHMRRFKALNAENFTPRKMA